MKNKITLEEILNEKHDKIPNMTEEELLKYHERFVTTVRKLKQILQDAKNENK